MTEEERTVSEVETPPPAERTAETPAAAGDATGARIAVLEARVADLERQLTTEHAAATDYMNRWQRAQADFANFKRRAQQDQEQLQRTLAIEAARLILPALDGFERAFITLPPSLRGYTWISGIALVEQQLAQALTLVGIQPITVEPGQTFDPAKHEAIGEMDTAEHPAGHVAAVVQRGYHVENHVLRPALVQLARAPESPPDEQAAEATTASSPATREQEAAARPPEPGES